MQYGIWENVYFAERLMSKTRLVFLLILILILIVAAALWVHHVNSAPPEVAFARVARETLVSTLPTNGKVEPFEWAAVRAERAGTVDKVAVQRGQQVAAGALIAELDARDVRAEVASARAGLAKAQAEQETLAAGGTAAARVEIDNELDRNRLELKSAQRNLDSLKRLAEKQAATQQDVAEASQRVQALQEAIQALERKRAALVGASDRAAAEAAVKEAQATLDQAEAQIERSRIPSPVAGVVYDLAVRQGSYANVGDLVASVGNLRRLRVRVFVDEPELGRVAVGMPVTVTWDALPGRRWTGSIEKTATQVVTMGTRQVGEVVSTMFNPDLTLVPGTNVNAEITSQVVQNALTIPKEAIRSENGQVGVYVLQGDHVEWRPIAVGASSITRAVVTSGLKDGDRVALRTEVPLHNGDRVRALPTGGSR